ncbi:MAG: hypothetical protein AAF594_05900 [Bacteroidota bacterium]
MALYELQDATLAGIDGQGYVFPIETFRGKEYRGVFFAGDDDGISTDTENARFEGTVYHKTTSGEDTVTVDVTNVVQTAVGLRADFKVVDD